MSAGDEHNAENSHDPTHSTGSAFEAAISRRSRPPEQIGRYRILEELGRGGMGVVYLAEHPKLGKRVAVKLMQSPADAPSQRERFEREFRLLAGLDHPNIVTIHDADFATDEQGRLCPYYVMERVREARSLTGYASAKGMRLRERLELFLRVCDAVGYLHQRGALHLDLKPSNILVGSDGEPKLVDFGLSRLLLDRVDRFRAGTLPYMSPEQCQGDPDDLDHRSDVYSLGCVLYELLAGRPPHLAAHMPAHKAAAVICQERPLPLGDLNPDCQGAIEAVVAKALDKNRDRRHDDARVLAGELRKALRPAAPPSVTAAIFAKLRWFADVRPRVSAALLCVAVVAPAMIATEYIAQPLLLKWTDASQRYWDWAGRTTFGAGSAAPALHEVAVVALRDQTNVESLARQAGLQGVRANELTSLRRLHRSLNEALARGAPNVVIWDIIFRSQTKYDEDFAAGVGALRDAGATVVVGSPSWRVDERGVPPISETILRSGVEWGSIQLIRRRSDVIVPLALKRDDAPPIPSLSLAGLAGHRRPGLRFDLRLDAERNVVQIEHWRPDALRLGGRRMAGPAEPVPVSTIVTDPPADAWPLKSRPQKGDAVAHYLVPNLPEDAAFEQITVNYEDVLTADTGQLRRWFGGKAVVIGDLRTMAGDSFFVGNRELHGAWLHTAALATLIADAGPQAVSVATVGVVWACAGLLGSVIGFSSLAVTRALVGRSVKLWRLMAGRSPRARARSVATLWIGSGALRWSAIALLAVMTLALGALLYQKGGWMIEPLPPVFCAALAAELIAIVLLLLQGRLVPARFHPFPEASHAQQSN